MDIDRDAIRATFFDVLESIASGGTSIKYGKTTPYLDYLEELLCMWFDEIYYQPANLIKDGVLSKEEGEVLDFFTEQLRSAYPKHASLNIVDINLLQGDPKWISVVSAAKKTLEKLHSLSFITK